MNEEDKSGVEGSTVNNIEGLQSHETLPPQTDTQQEGGLEGGLEGRGRGDWREGLTYREGGTGVFINWIEFPNRPALAA